MIDPQLVTIFAALPFVAIGVGLYLALFFRS
jgi:hypothetical protein